MGAHFALTLGISRFILIQVLKTPFSENFVGWIVEI
ncbi:hypothetical protein SAMN05216404_1155 [Nitrosospira multiformis]|uniref:Uncharacterized protein n=1 Tax=Nitrosospira multiformis TaxID=1231 RepID=A0A1H8N3I9_9PROT|nr:hypothetical protein SAMN05216404_1155 [Nitrosospira multiformis]